MKITFKKSLLATAISAFAVAGAAFADEAKSPYSATHSKGYINNTTLSSA